MIERVAGGADDAPSVVADPNGIWLYVDFPARHLPERGWKLHVSATPWNAGEVLEACVPVLTAERVTFKIAATPERLLELNQGMGGTIQAGKFLTAYPFDADEAVRVARSLDAATNGMRGPRVLGDRALSPSSLVHYRYADYVFHAGEGDPDRSVDPPKEDPFVAAGIVPERRARLVADRYLITANLHRSVRGAVHLAVDARARRTCILKRAWRDAGVMPDGTDARDRLRDEAEIMRALQPDPHFPELWDLVEDERDLFLVMEHLEGQTFAKVVHGMHADGRAPDDRTIVEWGLQLAKALETIHARGLVHRDLNPVNIIVGNAGEIRLVDFELARRQGTRHEGYGAGTTGYMSPGQAASEEARVLDDLFGLGALLYLATTGTDPEPGIDDPGAVVNAAPRGVAPALAEVIAACLAFDETRAASASEVRMDLQRALRA